jgi:hypothetical protein
MARAEKPSVSFSPCCQQRGSLGENVEIMPGRLQVTRCLCVGPRGRMKPLPLKGCCGHVLDDFRHGHKQGAQQVNAIIAHPGLPRDDTEACGPREVHCELAY